MYGEYEYDANEAECNAIRARTQAYERQNAKELSERITALEAEVERMRADAERYRWLRDRLFAIDFTYTEENLSVLVFHAPPSPIGAGSSLDAAIDAAREGKNDAAK